MTEKSKKCSGQFLDNLLWLHAPKILCKRRAIPWGMERHRSSFELGSLW